MVFHNLWDNSGTQASATLLSLARLSEKTCDETIMSGICLDRHLKTMNLLENASSPSCTIPNHIHSNFTDRLLADNFYEQ